MILIRPLCTIHKLAMSFLYGTWDVAACGSISFSTLQRYYYIVYIAIFIEELSCYFVLTLCIFRYDDIYLHHLSGCIATISSWPLYDAMMQNISVTKAITEQDTETTNAMVTIYITSNLSFQSVFCYVVLFAISIRIYSLLILLMLRTIVNLFKIQLCSWYSLHVVALFIFLDKFMYLYDGNELWSWIVMEHAR